MSKAKSSDKAVVVCTDKRGVFFGYTSKTDGATVTIKRARMCVRWDEDTRGVVGLAASGPGKGCRVTAPAPSIELRGITCVMECDPVAVEAWERSPWQ